MRKLIVIRESLAFGEFQESWGPCVKQFQYALADGTEITISEFMIDVGDLHKDLGYLAERLHASRYYAHVVGCDVMWFAFPGTIVRVRRGYPEDAALCRTVASNFLIPPEEMVIELMFDIDHPNYSAT
jgi:hypothetical protein